MKNHKEYIISILQKKIKVRLESLYMENNRLAPIEITLETTSGNILVEKNNM